MFTLNDTNKLCTEVLLPFHHLSFHKPVGVSKQDFCPILGGYTTLAVQQSDVSFVVICPSRQLHNSAGPRPGQSFFCPCSSLCLPALILAWLHNYTNSAKFIRHKPENIVYICVSHKGLGNPYFWIY